MAKVIIYLRVSTTQQSVDNQLPVLKEWVASRDHELVAIYQGEESAWRSGHKRELARLIDDLPKRKVKKCARCWAAPEGERVSKDD
jgi:DNA invertase Pin-like site-specific DNA recombinase